MDIENKENIYCSRDMVYDMVYFHFLHFLEMVVRVAEVFPYLGAVAEVFHFYLVPLLAELMTLMRVTGLELVVVVTVVLVVVTVVLVAALAELAVSVGYLSAWLRGLGVLPVMVEVIVKVFEVVLIDIASSVVSLVVGTIEAEMVAASQVDASFVVPLVETLEMGNKRTFVAYDRGSNMGNFAYTWLFLHGLVGLVFLLVHWRVG